MPTLNDLLLSLSESDRAEVAKEFEEYRKSIPLSALRETAGLTQEAVANALGTSQAAISKLERRSDVLLSTLFTFAKAIGALAHVEVMLKGAKFILQPHFEEESEQFKAGCSFSLREIAEVAAGSKEWAREQIRVPERLVRSDAIAANDTHWSSTARPSGREVSYGIN